MVCDVIDNNIAFWGKVYGLIQTLHLVMTESQTKHKAFLTFSIAVNIC